MLDDLVSSVLSFGQNKLEGEANEDEKTTFKSAALRFVITTIWVAITFVVLTGSLLAMMAQGASSMIEMFSDAESSKAFGIFAILMCLAIAVITFLVPYLRKKGSTTRWCGVICLFDALWWIYLLATNFGLGGE